MGEEILIAIPNIPKMTHATAIKLVNDALHALLHVSLFLSLSIVGDVSLGITYCLIIQFLLQSKLDNTGFKFRTEKMPAKSWRKSCCIYNRRIQSSMHSREAVCPWHLKFSMKFLENYLNYYRIFLR